MCTTHNAADHSELRLRNKFSRLRPNPDGALFAFDHMALQSEQLAQSVKCYLKFRLLAYMSGKRFRLSSYTVINEIPTNIFDICSGVTCPQFPVTEPLNIFNPPFQLDFDEYCVAAHELLDSAGKVEC